MKTQEKLEMVKDVVVSGYESELGHDEICGLVLAEKFDGIRFGEISALVKNIGETENFIINQAQARKNAEERILEDDLEFDRWEDVEAYADEITAEFGIENQNWALNKTKAIAKKRGIELPAKLEATKWQLAAIEAFRENPELSVTDLAEALVGKVSNAPGYARLVYPIVKALI